LYQPAQASGGRGVELALQTQGRRGDSRQRLLQRGGGNPAVTEASGEFLGHPRGLAYIAFTEAWERFSFYGMQAVLTLYMTGHLLKPGAIEHVLGLPGLRALLQGLAGPMSIQGLASTLFGLYVGLVYFTPVAGGLIGDRLIGRKSTVLSGGALMA